MSVARGVYRTINVGHKSTQLACRCLSATASRVYININSEGERHCCHSRLLTIQGDRSLALNETVAAYVHTLQLRFFRCPREFTASELQQSDVPF